MTTYKNILRRRSIRRFKQQKIPFSVLSKLVNSARLAPSAANLQPLEYVIVDNPEQTEGIFESLNWARYITPQGDPRVGERPVAYIVVLNNNSINSPCPRQDWGAAMMSMILAAMEDGIGSCWLESVDKEKLARALGLPGHMEVGAVLALGYEAERPVAEELEDKDGDIRYWKDDQGCLHVPKRRLADLAHYNTYQEKCPPAMTNEEWAVLWETALEEEAYLIQGFMQNNDIPCVMEVLKFHEMPVNFGSMSKVRLLVPDDRLEEGEKLIAERNELLYEFNQNNEDDDNEEKGEERHGE